MFLKYEKMAFRIWNGLVYKDLLNCLATVKWSYLIISPCQFIFWGLVYKSENRILNSKKHSSISWIPASPSMSTGNFKMIFLVPELYSKMELQISYRLKVILQRFYNCSSAVAVFFHVKYWYPRKSVTRFYRKSKNVPVVWVQSWFLSSGRGVAQDDQDQAQKAFGHTVVSVALIRLWLIFQLLEEELGIILQQDRLPPYFCNEMITFLSQHLPGHTIKCGGHLSLASLLIQGHSSLTYPL
jgi:hypothetical protein